MLMTQQRDFELTHKTMNARLRELEEQSKTCLSRKEAENLELCRQRVFELEGVNTKLQKVIKMFEQLRSRAVLSIF